MAVDQARVEDAVRELLAAIGENPDRPGLLDTPWRVGKWWAEFIDWDGGNMVTSFPHAGVAEDLVMVSGLGTWTLCEHHLLPVRLDAALGYLPKRGEILGLSKFARILHHQAHRLTTQEALADDIADTIEKATGAMDVAVILRGEHLCMTMRGVKTEGTFTTSVMRGRFRESGDLRREFLSLT
jgi:GTP cyclohydrolase I